MPSRLPFIAVLTAAFASMLAGGAADAQSLGTFTWQLQPFCNRLVVTVTQAGALYHVDGYDDQCGAPQRAALVGLATPNPDGTIGFGLNIVTAPGGRNVHVDARIDQGSLGGPWSDSAGNSGAFVLGGAAAGSPRPAPALPGAFIAPGSIAGAAIAPGAVGSGQIAANAVSSAQTSNEPGLAYAVFVPPLPLPLPSSPTAPPTSVVSTSLRVPADGYVKIEVAGSWSDPQGGPDAGVCQLQKGDPSRIDNTAPVFHLTERTTGGTLDSFAAHRVVPVSVADNPTLVNFGQFFHLVCRMTSGSGAIWSANISATYYPTSYAPPGVVLPNAPAALPPQP